MFFSCRVIGEKLYKIKLLDIAIKFANLIVDETGPDPKLEIVTDHPLSEEAFLGLYEFLLENDDVVKKLEVQPRIITVLSDTAERAEDLDEAAILKAKEEAEQALHEKDSKIDYAKAQIALAEAAAQLQTLQRLRKRSGR